MAKYQCGSLGKNGNFKSRTTTEMNIYYDSNYEVAGGLGDEVMVKAFEEYEVE